MIEQPIREKVARCVAIGAQHATNDDFSATLERNSNARNSLKSLAGVVLRRNSQRNNSATDTQNHAQQIGEKKDEFVAQSCVANLQDYDTRRHCRQCLNLKGGYCTKRRFRPLDDIPRHCEDYLDNELQPPTKGLFERWA